VPHLAAVVGELIQKTKKGGAMLGYSYYPAEIQAKFESYYERIRNELDWGKVLPEFFQPEELKKVYGAFYAKCLYHQEKTASMRFSNQLRVFHCYGCGIGGGPFSFIVRKTGSQTAAMWFIKKRFHIPLPFTKKEWSGIQSLLAQRRLAEANAVISQLAIENYDDAFKEAPKIVSRIDQANFELLCIGPIESYPRYHDEQWYIAGFNETKPVIQSQAQGIPLRTFVERMDIISTSQPIITFRMKKLFIIRHGRYGHDGRLNEAGVEQMHDIAEKLKLLIKAQEKVIMITSTAPRALDSAEVLSQDLGIPYQKDELFWSDSYHDYDYDAAFSVLGEKGEHADVVILVSHLEYCSHLPWMFATKAMNILFPGIQMEKGECCLCDFEASSVTRL
jgi:phosphohistidine phosphatase SixA